MSIAATRKLDLQFLFLVDTAIVIYASQHGVFIVSIFLGCQQILYNKNLLSAQIL
jgi:hypothetical protein